MRLTLRAWCLTATLFAGTLWPALPGIGAGTATGPQGAPRPGSLSAGQDGSTHPVPPKDAVSQCLHDHMNHARVTRGLSPLLEIPWLLAVAQKHSDKMAAEQSIHHSTEAVFETLPPGWLAYGENVVYGKTCEQMVEALLASEPHREAMLRPDFNVSGTAVSAGNDGWIYATIVFLNLPVLPAPPEPVPGPPAPPALAPAAPPAPPALPEPPSPVPLPIEEPIPTISLFPIPIEAQTAERGSPGAKKRPDRTGRVSRRSPRQVVGEKAGPAPAEEPLTEETSVWLLDAVDPQTLPPEPEADPSQMIFELEDAPQTAVPQPTS